MTRPSKSSHKYTSIPVTTTELPDDLGTTILSESSDAENGLLSEFKDKPFPSRRRNHHSSRFIHRSLRRIRRTCRVSYILGFLMILLGCQLLFNNSYPDSQKREFIIPAGEKVFIAANILDGEMVDGQWGDELVRLVERIGKERVHVSIYGGPRGALKRLAARLECGKNIVFEGDEPLDLKEIPRVELPNGETKIKRIAYLAEVRNKALKPLEGLNKKGERFEKVLFINDVWWRAEDAERLIWGTKTTEEGEGYKAVCAVDFVTSWKMYDTFATRDTEGYSIGVPIFPWFGTGKGMGEQSRNDVLAGKEAVRVKSCWGGMVAFDGRYFQNAEEEAKEKEEREVGEAKLPLRFRSEEEPFWDSSECCLIHADIMSLPTSPSATTSSSSTKQQDGHDTGIYMNPFVRVSYSGTTQKWIPFWKHFERLGSLPQRIINFFAKLPRFNYRRDEIGGQTIPDKIWVNYPPKEGGEDEVEVGDEEGTWQSKSKTKGRGRGRGLGGLEMEGVKKLGKRNTIIEIKEKAWWREEGFWRSVNRTSGRGGYCGVRQLLVFKEGGEREAGAGNWDNLLGMVPPLDV